MKREDLKGLGLEDSVIDSVMDLHGQDMAGSKSRIAALEANNSTLQTELGTAKTRVSELEKVDVSGISTERDNYKALYESSVIENALSGYKFTSNFAKQGVIAELKKNDLKFDNGKIADVDKLIKEIQKNNPDAFVTKDDNGGTPPVRFSTGQHGSQTKGDAGDINALIQNRFGNNKYFKK